MALSVTENDPRLRLLTSAAGTEEAAMADTVSKVFGDKRGVAARIVRGSGDTDITALVLKNEDGTEVYVYPNAAGNGLIVTTTAP